MYKKTLMKFYRVFGTKLRKARKSAGLTQEALADRVKLSRTSITNIELGKQHIPLHMLETFASAVGVQPCALLPEKKTDQVLSEKLVREHDLAETDKEWISRVVSGTNAKEETQ